MSIFITGATGFLGSYIVAELLAHSSESLALLVRSRSQEEAEQRLWRSLQLHMNAATFWEHRQRRLELVLGDITQNDLGLKTAEREKLIQSTDSVIHAAASLNRKSEEVCANVNLKGSLEVIQLARAIQQARGLRRFSLVSTVAVSGIRQHEVVQEDTAIRWNRPDLDPYGRTKKMSEHMTRRLLSDLPVTVFRPSAIIGDSRFCRTTQFDMLRAFAWMQKFRILPLNPEWRIDIVPADFVGRAIAQIHQKAQPLHDIYHLSAGTAAVNYRQIAEVFAQEAGGRKKIFAPRLAGTFMKACERLANSRLKWSAVRAATLVQVFRPHLLGDTVFDNSRIVQELGENPVEFTEYAPALLKFAIEHQFKYPHAAATQLNVGMEVA